MYEDILYQLWATIVPLLRPLELLCEKLLLHRAGPKLKNIELCLKLLICLIDVICLGCNV